MLFPHACFARSFRRQQQTQTGRAPIPHSNEVIFIDGQVCFGAHDACRMLRERARAWWESWDSGTLQHTGRRRKSLGGRPNMVLEVCLTYHSLEI